jgi:hypothetical protein
MSGARAFFFDPGASPPDPLHALSRAASTARSVRVARFASLARVFHSRVASPRPPYTVTRGGPYAPLRSGGSLRCARSRRPSRASPPAPKPSLARREGGPLRWLTRSVCSLLFSHGLASP